MWCRIVWSVSLEIVICIILLCHFYVFPLRIRKPICSELFLLLLPCSAQHSTAHLMWFHNCFIGKTKRKIKTRQQFICNPHCQMVVIYKIDCFQWIWHHTIGFSKPTVYLTQIATHKFTSNTHTRACVRTQRLTLFVYKWATAHMYLFTHFCSQQTNTRARSHAHTCIKAFRRLHTRDLLSVWPLFEWNHLKILILLYSNEFSRDVCFFFFIFLIQFSIKKL